MNTETLGTFVFLIICGHWFWFVGAEPRFTNLPSNPTYRKVDETATFKWVFVRDNVDYLFGVVKKSGVTLAQVPAGNTNPGIVGDASFKSRASITADDRTGNSFTVTFELRQLKRSDDGTYEYEIQLSGTPKTNSVSLVVVVLPTITFKDPPPPKDYTVTEGQNEVLRCAADGNPKPTIEWSKDNIVLETNKNLTLNPIKRGDAGVYKCKAIVRARETYEDFYTLRVIVQFKPYITSKLSNRTVNEGNSISFDCEAVGNPNVITYHWYKNNVKLASSGNYEITDSARGKRLTVKSAQKEDIGPYKCTGENLIGEGEGSVGYLSVKYKPTFVDLSPYPDVTKESSESVTLTCQADGAPAPSYSWEFRGHVISGQAAKTLVLNNLQKSNIGNYSCVAKNDIGSTRNYTMVFVRYQPTTVNLTTGTVNNAVVEGSSVTLVCLSDGYPEPTYTFKKGSTQLVTGSSSNRYSIPGKIALSQEGDYSCTPRNVKGEGPPGTMKLIVYVKPVFTNTIQSVMKKEKDNFTYTCTVKGKPAPSIVWYKDGIIILKSSIYSLVETVGGSDRPKVLMTTGNLIMTGITWRQQGIYSCNASNPAGEESRTANLTVEYRPVVQNAADHPKNKTILENEDVTFSCKMIGNPSLEGYFWQVNGKNITNFRTESGISYLTVTSAKASNVGTYSCLGYNNLGIGPPASAYLLIKIPPVIIDWPDVKLIVNETHPATMICKANGVPAPTFYWTKGDSSTKIAIGSTLRIANTSFSDTGSYRCTATNEMGNDFKTRQLVVQVKPDITTTAPLETNIPRDASTNKAFLRCSARTVPKATMEWRKDGKVLESGQDYVITTAQSVAKSSISIELLNIKTIGEKFTCWAKNLLGTDEQLFVIREKGTPDEPIELQAIGKPAENAGSVVLNFTWTPGYGGGVEQSFIAFYRKQGNSESEISVPVECDKPRLCLLTVENLEPETTYDFFVQAKNQFGLGKTSAVLQYKTPASTQRGTVKAVRTGKGTEVVLSWSFTDEKVTRVNVFYRELGTGSWTEWEKNVRTRNITVSGLELKTAYEFRVEMLYENEVSGVGVVVKVPAGPVPGTGGSQGLSETHIIAIAVACAGVLFIALVILALCLCKKRKKPYGRDDRVEMNQTRTPPFTSYAAGGPDIISADQRNRQSFSTETVEDDPFVEAHRDALRKKKADPSVNYGYASQDSFQQREMLLDPGSRLLRNDRMTRSMDDLDPSHDYPARGPQRDFSTLPPYHEPPSFEEAMRQSGKKAKNRVKSTGDILDEGRPRPSGRRPRHARSPDDQTDSSESDARYNRRPPPGRKMKSRDSDDPGYASVDPVTRGFVPRHPAPAPPQNALDRRRNGPPDPDSPYALPQKRNKLRNLKNTDSSEPLMGPPPQYTPQDRMSMPELDELHRNPSPGPQHPRNRPRPIAANDLDLDDQDQPDPDLPPAMPVFPATRSYPSLHDPNDGLPEPPAFLRDVLDEPRGMRSSRGRDSGFATEPRQPSRKPYINIHGQLVRPGSPAGSTRSSRSDGLDRLDPMRSSNNALQPEPEVPPAQRHQSHPDDDDQQAEMNYVSYLV